MTIKRHTTLSSDESFGKNHTMTREASVPHLAKSARSSKVRRRNQGGNQNKHEKNGDVHQNGVVRVRRRSEGDSVVRYDQPIHEQRDSLFSSSSGYTNYRGFLNLCILLLVVSNARLAVENILKYGILADPFWFISVFLAEPYHWPNLILVLGGSVFVYIAYTTELLLARNTVPHRLGMSVHVINCFILLCTPVAVILKLQPNPVASCMSCAMYTLLFLKLVSYVQVNSWCRKACGAEISRKMLLHPESFSHFIDRNGDRLVIYPFNLDGGDLLYFLAAPTLCYELNFPRTSKFRKWFVAKRFMELVFLSQLIIGLSQQWIVPLLRNSVAPLIHVRFSSLLSLRLDKARLADHLIIGIAILLLCSSLPVNFVFVFVFAIHIRIGSSTFALEFYYAKRIF